MLRGRPFALLWSFVRLAGAAVGIAAVIAQLSRSIARAGEATEAHAAHVPTVVANFLSFFTIESNLIAIVTLTIGAVWTWRPGADGRREPGWFAVLLACATTYMVITGIVYNTLLRGIVLDQGVTVGWANEVLHVVVPVVMALDLFLAPQRRALPWRAVGIVVIYPIVWVVYTLIRGPFIIAPATGDPWWYPYPFLDPHNFANGFGGVALYVVGIAAGIILVGFLVIWVGRYRAAQQTSREPGDDARVGGRSL